MPRLKRMSVPPSVAAEYEAAKAEYAGAVERLSKAKAAVTAVLDQEAERRRVARLSTAASALAAWLGGAGTREVCEIAGLKPAAPAVYAMQWHLQHEMLSHEELYVEGWDKEGLEDRQRRLTKLALARYKQQFELEMQ